MNQTDQHSEPAVPLTLRQTIVSVLWAFYGVQSGKNRERDFARGNAGTFMAVGFGMTALFVLLLIGVVRTIVAVAGGT